MSETTEAPAVTAPEPAEDPAAVAADLRRRLNEATAARQAAERRAQEAIAQAGEARTTAIRNGEAAISAQADAVTNAVTAGEARLASFKRDLSAALQAGEYDKAADIQADMAELGGNLASARAQKAQMEERRQETLRAPPPLPPAAPAAPQHDDPLERFIAGDPSRNIKGRTPATAAWLRKNRAAAVDANGIPNKRVQAADLMAQDAGHEPDSPDYFKFIEAQLGMNKTATAAPQSPSNGQGQRRTAPAAPPARSADYGGGERPRSGYISPEVVDRAAWMGITPQELQAGIDAEERSGGFINGNPYGRR